MRKFLLLLSLFSLTQSNAQQNLVLNPSFEDVHYPLDCVTPIPTGAPFLPFQFWNPISSPDPFSLNYQPFCQLYALNNYGNQLPRTGDNFIGISNVYNINNDYREYILGELITPLVVGYRYNINFFVSVGGVSNSGMNNIGVKFLDYIPNTVAAVFPSVPDVNYVGTPILDNQNWVPMDFQFVPNQPNQKYFAIGNFYDLNATTTTFLPEYNLTPATTFPICYVLIDDVDINVELPIFDIDREICQGDFYELPTTSLNGYTGTWTPAFNNQQTTTYSFIPQGATVGLVQETIIVNQTVIPSFNSFGPFCGYDTFFNLPTISNNGVQGSWSEPFDPFVSKTYTFTPINVDCAIPIDIDIKIFEGFDFELIHYCENQEYFIEIIKKTSFDLSSIQYNWKINNNIIINNNVKLNLSDYKNLLRNENFIEVTLIDENGCEVTHQLEILGKYFCEIQKGISPNGDGLNDNFNLFSFGKIDLKILNRYGKVVYEKSNYTNEWQGQSSSGGLLPSGTYFYIFSTLNNDVNSGWIQLSY